MNASMMMRSSLSCSRTSMLIIILVVNRINTIHLKSIHSPTHITQQTKTTYENPEKVGGMKGGLSI